VQPQDRPTAGATLAPDEGTLEVLRARYRAYCDQQAAALPGLLPREGLRALYRSARAAATGPVDDPLALLVAHCRRLLPLPPFEVWLDDYLRDRAPYAEALDAVGAPRQETPVTVDVRTLEHEGRAWVAGLALFREPVGWRGFISFHAEESDPGRVAASHPRTADIFHEDSSEAVRERFRSFTPDTLQAFLRSALP
jgi:hypothetical protein